MRSAALRVWLLGATGTIGRATAAALVARGHVVTCLVRAQAGVGGAWGPDESARALPGTRLLVVDPGDPDAVTQAMAGARPDAILSCLASRTGAPADAWAVDHAMNLHALRAAQASGVGRFVLLSAICVQKPRLAFQQAKLAFEAALIDSGLDWTIVRPTAFFKSLSGQIDRVRRGRPFLLFGDGTLTACKPIGDADCAAFLADCLTDDARRNRILPIGGPGPAITPRAQGEMLFAALGRPPRFRQVPVALLDGIVATLGTLGRVSRPLAAKAELARIGRYYATESMLVLDPRTGRYDADATPETGGETLADHYRAVLTGAVVPDRGDHAVF